MIHDTQRQLLLLSELVVHYEPIILKRYGVSCSWTKGLGKHAAEEHMIK